MAEAAEDKPTPARAEEPAPEPWMPNPFEGETVTRRRVFEVAGQAIGGLFGVAVALPVVGFAVAPIFDRPEETWRRVGPVDDFTSKTYRQRVITLVDGIGEAGKTTVYIRRGSTQYGEDPDEFVAISTRCAHLGCPVRFVQSAGNFICPCHGGIYDFEGKVIGGPPVRPLDRFQTRVSDDGQLEIGPRYSVTSQLEPVRARDPGQFTGGIWEIIYPPRPTTAPPPN